jgi:hypothetical protein
LEWFPRGGCIEACERQGRGLVGGAFTRARFAKGLDAINQGANSVAFVWIVSAGCRGLARIGVDQFLHFLRRLRVIGSA